MPSHLARSSSFHHLATRSAGSRTSSATHSGPRPQSRVSKLPRPQRRSRRLLGPRQQLPCTGGVSRQERSCSRPVVPTCRALGHRRYRSVRTVYHAWALWVRTAVDADPRPHRHAVRDHVCLCGPEPAGPTIGNGRSIAGAGTWRTLREVTFPLALPGVAGGFVLAFVISFDEVIVATFLLPGVRSTTLPLRMFQSIQGRIRSHRSRGLSPPDRLFSDCGAHGLGRQPIWTEAISSS